MARSRPLMSAAARDAGVMLHAGSIVERPADGASGPEGKHLWNTSLVFAADGSLAATYRKIHRFGFGQGEPLLMEAGDALSLLDVPDSPASAGAVRAALSTCYDLRFPELYRAQLDAGATLFVIPAAWPAARVRHWTLLAHARAIENQCVVVACNTAGTHAGVEMGGHSQVVLPTGDVAGHGRQRRAGAQRRGRHERGRVTTAPASRSCATAGCRSCAIVARLARTRPRTRP